MKNILFLFILLIFSHKVIAQNDTTQILFIGNSITYFNQMPQTFEAIANQKGNYTQVTMHAPGGTGFVHHANSSAVFNLIRQAKWDFIVLQPGSNESPGYSLPIQQTLQRAKTLKDSIKHYNPCTQILYYEISYGVWGNSANDLNTYNNTMQAIRTNLTYLADSTQCFFAPVGEAFRTAWNANTSNLLWGSYGDIHPNAKGSYIAACVFYASIFQETSLGTTVLNGLPLAEARQYQQLADTIVLHHKADWRINNYLHKTIFRFTQSEDTIHFQNQSINADSIFWRFGDGNTSLLANPIHFYASPNNYTVQLESFRNGCKQNKQVIVQITDSTTTTNPSDSSTVNPTDSTTTINPSDSSLLNINEMQLMSAIYPNPAQDFIFIPLKNANQKNYSFRVYSLLGKQLLQSQANFIDVSHLAKGIYFLKINEKDKPNAQIIKWEKE